MLSRICRINQNQKWIFFDLWSAILTLPSIPRYKFPLNLMALGCALSMMRYECYSQSHVCRPQAKTFDVRLDIENSILVLRATGGYCVHHVIWRNKNEINSQPWIRIIIIHRESWTANMISSLQNESFIFMMFAVCILFPVTGMNHGTMNTNNNNKLKFNSI